MPKLWTHLFFAALASSALACGSTDTNRLKAGETTGAGAGGGGGGETATTSSAGGGGGGGGEPIPYPAPHPGMPEITKHQGVVLHDPVIVTVTFPNDPLNAFLHDFDDAIGQTPWWTAVNGEYGVGPATGGAHLAMGEMPPDAIKDSEIQQWLRDRVTDGTFPVPTDQTVYVLYYPDSTTVTLDVPGGGTSCQDFAAYHFFTYVSGPNATKIPVAYAVIPRCGGGTDALTVSASHELAESVTDPHPAFGMEGYSLETKTPWNIAGGETADMCEFVSGTTEGPYQVTRAWSNQNAKIGQQPCVPVPPDPANLPYYNAAITQEIVKAKAGDTVEIDVACYSFDALPNAMTLEAQTFSQGVLTFDFDPPTCDNGTVVKMTVHVGPTAKTGKDYHYSLLAKLSADSAHLWRGIITVQ